MAGRGRGKFTSNSNQHVNNTTKKCEIQDPVKIYYKMSKKFPDSPNNDSIEIWIKDLIKDVIENPETIIDVLKYLLLFINMKRSNPSTTYPVRRCFFQQLEFLYNDFTQAECDSSRYRNFTFFFGASTYYVREPGCPPLKDLMAALLILINKLNIINDIEDFIVYSKCVAWLSRLIPDPMDGSILSVAYKESLNQLKELVAAGKGNLICMACLEITVNQGSLAETSREFYRVCLSEADLKAIESDLSIIIPNGDRDKFLLDSFSNVKFV